MLKLVHNFITDIFALNKTFVDKNEQTLKHMDKSGLNTFRKNRNKNKFFTNFFWLRTVRKLEEVNSQLLLNYRENLWIIHQGICSHLAYFLKYLQCS